MFGRIIICCLLFSLNAAAQEQDTTRLVSVGLTVGESAPGLENDSTCSKRLLPRITNLKSLQQFLDEKARKKVDPRYIEVPVKPWRVIARYKWNVVDVDYNSSTDIPDANYHADWQLCFEPPMASSIGMWVGYRGTGVSFSKSLTKNAGRYFSISTTGAKYGFNFRLRRFSTSDMTAHSVEYENGNTEGVTSDSALNMPAPVWIRSVYVNGYYVFNGRRYSQAAAYNQSVIQRRSAGSFVLGATWYQSSFDMSDYENTGVILLNHNVGKIKVHQANIGFGYGYNWVPFRGFVVNALAMPTISVYNRVKVYKYDFNYCLPTSDTVEDNYGNWNKETRRWENGETHKPMTYDEEQEQYVLTQFDWWPAETDTDYSALHLNLDLRLGIAYNWKNYFVGLQSQYNNFIYKMDRSKVNIYDAYARLALGVRL